MFKFLVLKQLKAMLSYRSTDVRMIKWLLMSRSISLPPSLSHKSVSHTCVSLPPPAPSIPPVSLHWLLLGQSMEKAEQAQVLTQTRRHMWQCPSSWFWDAFIIWPSGMSLMTWPDMSPGGGQRSGQGLSTRSDGTDCLVRPFKQCSHIRGVNIKELCVCLIVCVPGLIKV